MRMRSGVLISILLLISSSIAGQSVTTPYSFYGLGEVNSMALAHNEAMGEIGVGMPDVYNINLQNPAWLTYNALSSFNFGVKGDVRRFQTDSTTGSDETASIRYMVIALPIINGRWGSSVSLLPYTIVNYELISTDPVENTSDFVENRFEGEGGLAQLSWSNGFRLFRNFNVGFRASYVFGQIDRRIQNVIVDADELDAPPEDFIIKYQESIVYKDIVYAAALAYKHNLGEGKFLNFGATYELSGTLQGEREESLKRAWLDEDLTEIILTEGENVTFNIPAKLGLGISFESAARFMVGMDFNYSRWTGSTNETNAELQNTLGFVLGASFTPDVRSVKSYFQRVKYRAGINFEQLPYVINGTEINEFGINFGASFPTNGVSSMDAAFRFGWRGTTENDLVRESFFQIVLGLTINDRWFIKRRYD